MKSQNEQLLTAVAAFAGGFLAGLLFAPQSGQAFRQSLADNVNTRTRKMGHQLSEIEARLQHLESQIHATGDHLSERVRQATTKAMDHYVPSITPEAEMWEIDGAELTRDLRRMPHQ